MVGRIQEHLEAIYGIRCELRAAEFLIDEDQARRLGGTLRADEELLVLEEGGDLEVGLFLSNGLLRQLEPWDGAPTLAVLDGELEGYCQMAEGVSHFLYLAHTAAQERTVSLLELEAQAEVDKFALCALSGWGRGARAQAAELFGRLFEKVGYRAGLSAPERWRYEEANRLARAFCKRLLPLVGQGRMDKVLSVLRHCYRLGAEAKLRHLSG
ncbi:MAG: hypothetical protein ACYC8T_27400 [Myxococcaceae bacterium]